MSAQPRTLWSLEGNSQRLDGGAMFGNAPRALWERWAQPDERNRIELACRCLLIRDGDRHILLETGIGAFFEPKLRDRFGVEEEEHVLLQELGALGLSHVDIDVVVLSHLHFDHAGGLLSAWMPGAEPELLFPNARYLVGARAWERAIHPHPRDKASFIPQLQPMLEASGRLELVSGPHSPTLGEDYRFIFSDGHTPGLMLTEVAGLGGPIVYASDLIPGRAWVHTSITMGYDRFPELLIDEKRALLEDLVQRNGRLFFTHDPNTALARVTQDGQRFGSSVPKATLRGVVA
ncbi:MAG: MBL fold metallo-hydrolase [Alphaproteobacteria bacterium]|nr:MBL fold metallo-hydrolase [Alphaproteobacteria bacterium]MCB9792588.1 MBL fold metallo-hydrolase [Alphaproteobacteria bacterium]